MIYVEIILLLSQRAEIISKVYFKIKWENKTQFRRLFPVCHEQGLEGAGVYIRQVFYNVVRGVPGIALAAKSIFLILPALVHNQ